VKMIAIILFCVLLSRCAITIHSQQYTNSSCTTKTGSPGTTKDGRFIVGSFVLTFCFLAFAEECSEDPGGQSWTLTTLTETTVETEDCTNSRCTSGCTAGISCQLDKCCTISGPSYFIFSGGYHLTVSVAVLGVISLFLVVSL